MAVFVMPMQRVTRDLWYSYLSVGANLFLQRLV